ncbi:hypothetical protein AAE478_001430 [Parahypoxylon ruwenzoriense]
MAPLLAHPLRPPLTYGGWTQSKNVGARIASILQEREAQDENKAEAAGQEHDTIPIKNKKRRRYKVVIHSSPFLRCVQTSIAIAAGLATNPPLSPLVERSPSPRAIQSSPLNPVPAQFRPAISAHAKPPHDAQNSFIEKSVVRLDPFLGEWLSPDYFEHITPPPKSSLMLATAKAELLRRENYNDYPHFHTRHTPSASSQLWSASPGRGGPLASSVTPDPDPPSGLDSLSPLKGALPRLRSDSTGNLDPKAVHSVSSPEPIWGSGYIAPIPSYALSTSEPIPRGYAAHARDACVDVDYQWDSSRDNLDWGDGGVLPEEWAAMHQRFRKGLRRLIEWYTTTENPGEMVTKTVSSQKSAKSPRKKSGHSGVPAADDEEVELENVVVLVSHGAGCNALIGAITQQPVLIDVAMSSITMAQRKPEFDRDVDAGISQRLATSLDEALLNTRTMMSEMFEIKLFANTEHLHSPVTPPTPSRSPSTAGRNPRVRYANGFSSALKEINFGASLQGSSSSGSRSSSANASLGSMRRGSQGPSSSVRPPLPDGTVIGSVTVDGGISNFSSTQQNHSGSSGLWAPPKQDDDVTERQADALMVLNLAQERESSKRNDGTHFNNEGNDSNSRKIESLSATKKSSLELRLQSPSGEEYDKFDENAVPHLWAGTGNGGLWGVPRPPGEAERLRDFSATKRRWTVNER